jgi:ubiquitin-conjugating enzyme E2 J2
MATPHATKRLNKEYAAIVADPPAYIIAHPSERNVLEWHYILTGPPETPYEGGQYWGTLTFPADYPFAPPAIRMHTPSGRFQPSTRLCLSISDFHPKSFNPVWSVSTILNGLLSFMTSEEMTTGSVRAAPNERRRFAQMSRWWNSTGGGTSMRSVPGVQSSNTRGLGAIKSGDGGAKFKSEWPELDEENWKWMAEHKIDPRTGFSAKPAVSEGSNKCMPEASALRRRATGSGPTALGAVVEGGQVAARNAGQGWLGRNKITIAVVVLVGYIVMIRLYDASQAAVGS